MTARRRIRGREVKQRDFIRSRGGIYSTDPRQVFFLAVKMVSDTPPPLTLPPFPKDVAHTL